MTTFKQAAAKINYFDVRNGAIRSKERIVSIDALRGFDMFWIMGGERAARGLNEVFDTPFFAGLNKQMHHAEWFGFQFYDIIMPLFIFLMGVSLVYSLRNRMRNGNSDQTIWKHTIKRVAILWILGMVLQGNLLSLDPSRFSFYCNTLHAIAIGYLIATPILMYSSVKWQVVWTAGLMTVYWLIIALVPVGGTTAGAYTPDMNVAIAFDNMVLGRFGDGTEYAWIIPSLNFAATTMLGVFCGYIMQADVTQRRKLLNLTIYGVSLIAAGLLLSIWHPIIKKIWTSSFTLFSGGICVLLLALFYLMIDIWNWKRATKWLVILGMNAIFGYIAWSLFHPQFIAMAKVVYQGLLPHIGAWLTTIECIGGFLVIFFLMRYMYKNKTFIKI